MAGAREVTTQDDHNIHGDYTAHDDRNKHGSSNYLYILRFQLPWCLRGAIDIVETFMIMKAVMMIQSLIVRKPDNFQLELL